MLKKAGMVVAATAASLLAISPLAFADEPGDDGASGVDKDSSALVSGLNGNNVSAPVEVCNNNVNAVGGQVDGLTAGLGVVAPAQSVNADTCGQQSGTGDTGN